jgi:hypothetical protein
VVPIIIFFLLAPVPWDMIEKTPLYSTPLVATGLWQTKDPQEITAESAEEIHNLGNDIIVTTNRAIRNDLEITMIKAKIYGRIEHPSFGPEVKKYMIRPDGYYADIIISRGFMTLPGKILAGVLILAIAIICIALYFPIVGAIINLFRSR